AVHAQNGESPALQPILRSCRAGRVRVDLVQGADDRRFEQGLPGKDVRQGYYVITRFEGGMVDYLYNERFDTTGCADGLGTLKWKGRIDMRLGGLRHDSAVQRPLQVAHSSRQDSYPE